MPETKEATNQKTDSDDLQLIREAAAEAGKIALRYYGNNPEVWLKGGQSPVSEADLAVDRFLQAFCCRRGRIMAGFQRKRQQISSVQAENAHLWLIRLTVPAHFLPVTTAGV